MPFIGRDGRTAFLPTSVNTSSSLKISNEGDLIVDTDTLFVDSSANRVGIGTASPSSMFDVEVGAGAGINFGNSGDNAPTVNFMAGSSRLESAAQILVGENNGGGDLLIGTKNASGTLTTRVTIDNSGLVKLPDNGKFTAGAGNDLQIYHNATNSYIENSTGSFFIDQTVDDNDLNFRCDNGSGGLTTYIQADGSTGKVKLFDYGSLKFETTTTGVQVTGTVVADGFSAGDDERIKLGADDDLLLYHDGANSWLINNTGDLSIRNLADDKDVMIQSDNGSGGFETYIQADGSSRAAKLFHSGGVKLETTSTGVTVSGALEVSAATNITVGGTALPSLTGLLGGSLSGTLGAVTMHMTAADPSSPVQGQFYFNSLDQKAKIYTGSSFVDLVPSGGGGGGGGGSSSDANATFRKYTYAISSTTNSVSGASQGETSAGSFVVGLKYTIKTPGNTDFTAIGSANNTAGTAFVATGVGSGTGDAYNTLIYSTGGDQNVEVYVNGVKAVEGSSNDYIATNGSSVNFVANLASSDVVDIQVYELLTNDAFVLAAGGTFTGNVGINTTSINNRLHIHSNSNEQGILLTQAGNNYSVIYSDANRTGGSSHLLAIEGHWNGTPVAEIALQTGSDTTNKDDGQIIFRTSSANNLNNSERLRITSAGNIGINNTDCPSKVTIGVVSSSSFNRGAVAIKAMATDANCGTSGIYIEEPSTESGQGEGYYITVNADGDLNFHNSGAAAATVTFADSDNVGIGTANPQEKLHVSGTSDFIVDTDASGLRFGSYGEHDIALVTGRSTPTNSTRVYIENGNGEALRITSGGIVLINDGGVSTHRSDAPLQIETGGNGNALNLRARSSDNIYSYINFQNTAGSQTATHIYSQRNASTNAGTLTFGTAAANNNAPAERLSITPDGYLVHGGVSNPSNYNLVTGGSNYHSLLIGSTNGATAALVLDGAANGDGTGSDYASIEHNTGGEMRYKNRQSSGSGGAGHVFYTTNSDTERFRITSDGNVSIGGKSNPDWNSTVDALTVGYAGVLYEDSYSSGTDNYVILGNNIFYSGSGGNKYIRNDEAQRIMMQAGTFYFQSASTGTAGNAITFADKVQIQSDRVRIYGDSNYFTDIIGNSQTTTANVREAGCRFIGPEARRMYFEIKGNDATDHIRFITSPNNNQALDYVAMHIGNNGNVGIGEIEPTNRLVVQKVNASGDVGVRIKNDTLTDGNNTTPTTASLYLNTSTGDFNTCYIQARRNDGDTHFGYSDPRASGHVPNMVISNDGMVTKPKNVAWSYRRGGSLGSWGSNTGLTYPSLSYRTPLPLFGSTATSTDYDTHSSLSTFSSGGGTGMKFTAPVAGKYMVVLNMTSVRCHVQTDWGSIGLMVNTTAAASTGSLDYMLDTKYTPDQSGSGTDQFGWGGSCIISLAANDYIVPYIMSCEHWSADNMMSFMGYLLG